MATLGSPAVAALAVALFAAPSWAIPRSGLVVLPVSGEDPELSIADPAVAPKLEFGVEYDFQAGWTGAPNSFFNDGTDQAAEVEPFGLSFEFLAFPEGSSESAPASLVLVITSLRSPGPNSPDPDFPPFVDAGFVPDAFLKSDGTTPLPTLFVTDSGPGGGQIDPKEGELFLAIEFDRTLSTPQGGSFEIGFLAPLPGTSVQFFHSAFLVAASVPEPAPALLVSLAIVALLVERRRRSRTD